MVMEGQGPDWAWLGLRLLGRDATAGECNKLLGSLFDDKHDSPSELVDEQSIEMALEALRRCGVEVPTKAEVARQTVAQLQQTEEGQAALAEL